jgi:hypothetical protein
LSKAFVQILEELPEVEDSAQFNRDDVGAIVHEAKEEVEKERPNGARLRALVAGIGSAIAYAPKLRAAYDTLKWAAGMIGVSLP